MRFGLRFRLGFGLRFAGDGQRLGFGRFSLGRLGVKFLFEPNSTAFNADRKLSASYPAWLREIAMRAMRASRSS